MKRRQRFYVLTLLFLIAYAVPGFAAEESEALFDGSSFEGWEGDLKWFRIEDGALVCGSLDERIPHNYFLCTETEYDDFELTLQFKVEGNANGGIQFRSQRVTDSTEVSGFQADLGWNFWGCLYDESRRNKTLACVDQEQQNKIAKKDDWNDYIIRAEGNRIQLFLNGEKTVDYTEEEEGIARTGIIGLQIHSGAPSLIRYRNISITPLNPNDAE